jgi:hypothetical protein
MGLEEIISAFVKTILPFFLMAVCVIAGICCTSNLNNWGIGAVFDLSVG